LVNFSNGVGAFLSTRPVNLAVYIFLGMIHDLMGVLSRTPFIGKQEIGIQCASRLYMLPHCCLEDRFSAARDYMSTHFTAALK
jgi:hypothetical protein